MISIMVICVGRSGLANCSDGREWCLSYGSSSGLPVSFPVKLDKGAHNKVDGTPQSLGKELTVVNRQCYRVLWIEIIHVQ